MYEWILSDAVINRDEVDIHQGSSVLNNVGSMN